MPADASIPGVRFESGVPIDRLKISDLNPRMHRDDAAIAEIAKLIEAHGFDPTCALKVHVDGNQYAVFAGGNRLLAARQAGLQRVPVYIYEERSEQELWGLAYLDNEQAGRHCQVSPVDVWCDYARRVEEGWTQDEIAESLGVSQPSVSQRLRLSQAAHLHEKVFDGFLDEGHCREILTIYSTSNILNDWLPVEQAQLELVGEVLDRHRGSSAGIKPTVKVVRDAVRRWKSLLQSAEDAWQSLPDDSTRQQFVQTLAVERIRSEAGISRVLNQVVAEKQRADEAEATRLRAEADARE